MLEVPAQKLLAKWLKANGVTQDVFAKNFGELNQSSVSSWIRGTSRPLPPFRTVIQAVTGIAEDEWLTADERRKRDSLLRAANRKFGT